MVRGFIVAELQRAGATGSVIFGGNPAVNYVVVTADIRGADSETQAGSRYNCQRKLAVMPNVGSEPLRLVVVSWIFSEADWALYALSGGPAARQVGGRAGWWSILLL